MPGYVGQVCAGDLRSKVLMLLSIGAVLSFVTLRSAEGQPSPSASPVPPFDCGKTDFQCDDGSCIPRESLCDNVTDCTNGEDEGEVQCGCQKSEFRCADGTCISDEMHCDGKNDCPGGGGEDETLCSSSECSASFFSCGALSTQCIELQRVCDGVEDCVISGRDEANCPPDPGTPCTGSEFECTATNVVGSPSSNTTCIPLRDRCDCSFECAYGQDELGCTLPVLTQPPESQVVASGGMVHLTCIADGTPTPTITWLRNLQLLPSDARYQVISVGGVGMLTIFNATVLDSGEYQCKVSISSHSFVSLDSALVNVTIDDQVVCKDWKNNQYMEGDRYYTVIDSVMGEATSAAADVIFVVDESGSMLDAQEWIREVVPLLNDELRNSGIGAGDNPNQFALVGFGRSNPATIGGTVLSQLGSVADFEAATNRLFVNGSTEDGYSAIEVALDQIQLRNGTAKIMILATDEDRTALVGKEGLQRDDIEQRLRDAGFVLNVVVSQGFLYDASDNHSFAFGTIFNGTCYAYDPVTSVDVVTFSNCVRDPDPTSSFGDTYEDYVTLAFNLQGASWDIQFISQLPDLSAFSQSFTEVKVEEVVGLMRECFVCTCQVPPDCRPASNKPVDECKGPAPPDEELVVGVYPNPVRNVPVGSDVTLTCHIAISPEVAQDEITVQWQFNGIPLCDPVNCTRSITLTNVDSSDDGLYICQVSALGKHMSGLASLTTVAPAVIVTPPNSTSVRQGKPLEVECTATGDPKPLVYWVRTDGGPLPANAEARDLISGARLTIDPAELEDSGEYACVATNCAGEDRFPFEITVNPSSCNVSDSLILLPGESRIVFMHEPAADIVLLVDESGSMVSEHQWLKQMVKKLDEMLKKHNVGVTRPNLIAVVGYGSQYQDYELGRVVSPDARQFVTADDIDVLVNELWVDGQKEDGYAAIDFAFTNLEFRSGTAKQYILITDEHRYDLKPGITYSSTRDLLTEMETRLNVIVSEEFEGGDDVMALGVDNLTNAYVYYPPAVYDLESPANLLVRVVGGGHSVPYSAHKSTHEDYTMLALEMGGSAWNLGLLSAEPPLSDAFTSAFVSVEVQEILDQLSSCWNCSCEVDGLQCSRLEPFDGIYPECRIPKFEDTILPLEQVLNVEIIPEFIRAYNYGQQNTSLECKVDGYDAAHHWTFNGGQLEPNNDISSSDGRSSVLTLLDPQKTNKGWYSCFAVRADYSQGAPMFFTNETGVATAYVEVLVPVVRLEPLRAVVDPGENVSFICSLREDGNFTWSFHLAVNSRTESAELPSNVVVRTSSRESVLTVIGVDKKRNEGLYTCRGVGSTQSGKDCAELFITGVVLPDPPVTTSVYTTPTPSYAIPTYTTSTPSSYTQTTSVYIEPMETTFVLTPSIYATSTLSIYTTSTSSSDLPSVSPPTSCILPMQSPALSSPMISPDGPIEASPGSSVEVTCTTTVANACITWQTLEDPPDLPEGIVTSRTGPLTSVFRINSVTSDHYTQYICSVGTLSTVFYITDPDPVGVRIEPATNITVPEDQITKGTPTEIACIFTCSICAGVSLQWSFDGLPPPQLPSGLEVDAPPTGRIVTLIFIQGSVQQTGEYVCSAVDDDDHTVLVSKSTYVTVLVVAEVFIKDRSKSVPRGESVTLTCESSRKTVFTWSFDSVGGPLPVSAVPLTINDTVSQLTVNMVTEGTNTGLYFCTGDFSTGERLTADADVTEEPVLGVVFDPPPPLNLSRGEDGSVRCSLGCANNCPTAQVTWIDPDGNELPRCGSNGVCQTCPPTQRTCLLEIEAASGTNIQNYTCRATIPSTNEFLDTPYTINLQ